MASATITRKHKVRQSIIEEDLAMVIRRLGVIRNAMDVKRLSLTGKDMPHMSKCLQRKLTDMIFQMDMEDLWYSGMLNPFTLISALSILD